MALWVGKGSSISTGSRISVPQISNYPASLNPLMWYKMESQYITANPTVSQVLDLSGNGRHATQPTTAEQPSISNLSATMNNRPAIACNFTGLKLPTYTLPTPCTIMVIGEVTTVPGVYGWFLCMDAVFGCQGAKYGSFNLNFSGLPGLSGTNVPTAILYYFDGFGASGVRLRYGGNTYATSSGTVGGVGQYSIGYRSDSAAQSMPCKVSEVAVFPGTLSASAVTGVSNYSQSLYGLAI